MDFAFSENRTEGTFRDPTQVGNAIVKKRSIFGPH